MNKNTCLLISKILQSAGSHDEVTERLDQLKYQLKIHQSVIQWPHHEALASACVELHLLWSDLTNADCAVARRLVDHNKLQNTNGNQWPADESLAGG